MESHTKSKEYSEELNRRYRATAMKVNVMIVATIALTGIGVLGHEVLHRPGHETELGLLSIVMSF